MSLFAVPIYTNFAGRWKLIPITTEYNVDISSCENLNANQKAALRLIQQNIKNDLLISSKDASYSSSSTVLLTAIGMVLSLITSVLIAIDFTDDDIANQKKIILVLLPLLASAFTQSPEKFNLRDDSVSKAEAVRNLNYLRAVVLNHACDADKIDGYGADLRLIEQGRFTGVDSPADTPTTTAAASGNTGAGPAGAMSGHPAH